MLLDRVSNGSSLFPRAHFSQMLHLVFLSFILCVDEIHWPKLIAYNGFNRD